MGPLSAVTAIETSIAASRRSVGRRDGARMFRAAVRHSRRVRLLRVAIPLVALLAIATTVLISWFNPLRVLMYLPKEGRLVVSGTKITMEHPRLAGFTHDSRSYELTARAAAQDFTKPDMVELKDIRAVVELQDKGQMHMTAPNGLYNSKTETLDLANNVLLVATSGFECRLSEAKVDIRKGNVVSDKPVDVKMSNGTINANRMEVFESGQLVRFGGGVVMNVTLGDAAPQAETTAGVR
jgi:lipopolysaccharide export system protein LptC